MKYIVVLGDGMSDEGLAQLAGKTPLEAAKTSAMDALARHSVLGLAQTVPTGMTPGSDVANLAILGYAPEFYYTGRAPLEILSLGVPLPPGATALRMNLVTLSDDEPFACKRLLDHAGSGITDGEAKALMEAAAPLLSRAGFSLYPGMSYRQLAVTYRPVPAVLAPPHDHLNQPIAPWLPSDAALCRLMADCHALLDSHPVNRRRSQCGLGKANGIWFWGQGCTPILPAFSETTGLKGAVISAVALLKGIAAAAQMTVISVPGADGTLHSNLEGKAQAAVSALLEGGHDFVYVHMEAPDEMSHQGLALQKVCAIEQLDSRIVAPIRQAMDASGLTYRMLILPDHGCSVRLRTHTAAPVPFLLYDSAHHRCGTNRFTEAEAAGTGLHLTDGTRLMPLLAGNLSDY